PSNALRSYNVAWSVRACLFLSRTASDRRAYSSGRRLSRMRILIIFGMLLLLSGCGDGNAPDEIWCDTGIGPGQVVYPRGICYSPGDDCFFIVDRHAHVQHLSRKVDCLNDWRPPQAAMA